VTRQSCCPHQQLGDLFGRNSTKLAARRCILQAGSNIVGPIKARKGSSKVASCSINHWQHDKKSNQHKAGSSENAFLLEMPSHLQQLS